MIQDGIKRQAEEKIWQRGSRNEKEERKKERRTERERSGEKERWGKESL